MPAEALARSRRLSREGDVVAAAALLQIIEGPDLPGHFERVAIDRVVPALDVDGTRPAGEPEFGDDVGPVAVAEAGGAHEKNFSLPKMPCSRITCQRTVASLPWTWKMRSAHLRIWGRGSMR